MASIEERAQTRVGTTLAGFTLERVLGVGGMAAVFAARKSEDGGPVAVKVLHRELAGNRAVRERFVREATAASAIDHRGVVRVLETGADDDDAFLVLELLEGETLDARLARTGGKLPLAEALSVTDRLLDVLEAAHKKGVIHRDLKPENVFLTTAGELKVLDFGIARVADAVGATKSGEVIGTPAFMPPEQAGGRTHEIDARTDLWAVGAIAFTMISGRQVHGEGTSATLMIRAATQTARPLRSAAPDTPEKVCEVIDVALAFDKNERWPSAKMMQRSLRAAGARP